MTVDVHYFGMVSDRLMMDSEKLSLKSFEGDLNLRDYFIGLYPVLKNMSFKIAVDQELTEAISNEDQISEIAILPPFAGG